MVHIRPDFNTKKAFLEAFKNGQKITVYQPGFFPLSGNNGVIEAPAHYHKWYLGIEWNENHIITKVKK